MYSGKPTMSFSDCFCLQGTFIFPVNGISAIGKVTLNCRSAPHMKKTTLCKPHLWKFSVKFYIWIYRAIFLSNI